MDTCELESLLQRTRVLKDGVAAAGLLPSPPRSPVTVRRAGVQDAIVIIVNFKYLMYYYVACLGAGVALSYTTDMSGSLIRGVIRRVLSWWL